MKYSVRLIYFLVTAFDDGASLEDGKRGGTLKQRYASSTLAHAFGGSGSVLYCAVAGSPPGLRISFGRLLFSPSQGDAATALEAGHRKKSDDWRSSHGGECQRK